eukprot:scaffold146075_cov19-Tisochrysis_lutea.AAC.1
MFLAKCAARAKISMSTLVACLDVSLSKQMVVLLAALCVQLQVRWTWRVKDAEGDEVLAQPANLSKQDFVNQLALMFDGREQKQEINAFSNVAAQAS